MRECRACGADLTGSHHNRKFCDEHCRRAQYGGTCKLCGAPTNGHDGPGTASDVCLGCYRARNAERNEQILGFWRDGWTGAEIAQRLGMGEQNVLAFVDAERHRGRPVPLHRARNRTNWPELERRWNAGEPGAQIALALGISAENVYAGLHKMRMVGIDVPERRPRRSNKAA